MCVGIPFNLFICLSIFQRCGHLVPRSRLWTLLDGNLKVQCEPSLLRVHYVTDKADVKTGDIEQEAQLT